MRAAFVTPYLPWPADTGGKLRSYYLLKGLAEHAEVDLYTFAHGATTDPGPLSNLCRRVLVTPLDTASRPLRSLLSLGNTLPRSVRYFQTDRSLRVVQSQIAAGYDLLVADEIVVAPYVTGARTSSVPRLINRQKIDYLHYAEMAESRAVGREKALDWIEARRLRTFEYAEMPRFQSVVVCSGDDAREARLQVAGAPIPIEIIVNGADTDYFQPFRTPDAHPTVLLLGTMHYYPNIDAVLHYVQTMHDALRAAIPDLRVLIVGHRPPPEVEALGNLPGITVTGSVPDIRPHLARSWVQLVPLRLGGGTRLKIVESMAAGLPVVSTSVGAQGLAVKDGVEMMLADDPADFVRKTVELLAESDLRETMARTARRFVEENYSWRSLGARFANLCAETVDRARLPVAL